MRTALFPGSFDPLHNGHVDIIDIAARLFDRVVVAAIRNPGKSNQLFTLEERKRMILEACSHLGNIEVVQMKTLTVDVARGTPTKPERLGHREYFIMYKHQDTPPLEIGCRA